MPFFRHPLAFPLGLEGIALLRSFAGDIDDRVFVERRLAEMRRLLMSSADEAYAESGSEVDTVSTTAGYTLWAETYDNEDNPLIKAEQPVVREILAQLPPGRALDVACGSGRHTAWLATRGHTVVGIDNSPAMLALARSKAPEVELLHADLDRLPVPTGSFDLVVCALALTHHADLPGALAEFARVLRPGGHIVLSDIHVLSLYLGGVAGVTTTDGYAVMPAYRYWASDYLTAALQAGLDVLECHEPRWFPAEAPDAGQRTYPDAGAAAYWDTPAVIVWHLRKPAALPPPVVEHPASTATLASE